MSDLPDILIIDDEEDLGEILADYLEDSFRCTVHSNPNEAIAQIEQSRFSLIISDLHMPALSGLAIIDAVKKHQPETPVLILTGDSPGDPQVLKALEHGARGVISKPFHSPDEVIEYLKSML